MWWAEVPGWALSRRKSIPLGSSQWKTKAGVSPRPIERRTPMSHFSTLTSSSGRDCASHSMKRPTRLGPSNVCSSGSISIRASKSQPIRTTRWRASNMACLAKR